MSLALADPTTSRTPTSAIVVRRVDDVHVVGSWGSTLILIWRGSPTAAAFIEINGIAAEFLASSAIPVSCLFIVERSSAPPGDEARKELAQFSREFVSRMSLCTVVAEGGGFRAALVRAVGVTLTTIMPHKSKFKFVNDMDEAVRLLERHLKPGTGGAKALLDAAEELRAKISHPAR